MDQFNVQLGVRSYPVFIGNTIARDLGTSLTHRFPKRQFALVTNATIAKLFTPIIAQWKEQFSPLMIIIPDGEQYKTIATWQYVLDKMLEAKLDRSAVMLAFGGGVVGDITGFAAACFMRGVDYVQIPTTLLAMVDSSVGGKTGVDHAWGKNLIGAFHQPKMVWADTAFLDILPEREFNAGLSELFKYAFIGGGGMFSFISDHFGLLLKRDRAVLAEGIRRSITIKAHAVSGDEREETGRRTILNFGHTFGHALERECGYTGILHGEAIWWGMRCACDMGMRLKTIPEASLPLYEMMRKKMIPISPPKGVGDDALFQAMFSDKKTTAGKLHFVLPTEPGSVMIKNDVPKDAVINTLRHVLINI
jgi:3-dehydroquinate synthase